MDHGLVGDQNHKPFYTYLYSYLTFDKWLEKREYSHIFLKIKKLFLLLELHVLIQVVS